MEAEGRIIERDWSKYDMEHVVYKPKGMTPEELQQGHDWANSRFYSYPSILKRIGNLRRSLIVFGPMNWDLRKAWKKSADSFVKSPSAALSLRPRILTLSFPPPYKGGGWRVLWVRCLAPPCIWAFTLLS